MYHFILKKGIKYKEEREGHDAKGFLTIEMCTAKRT